MESIYLFIDYSSFSTPIILLLSIIFGYKGKNFDPTIKVLFYYCILGLANDLLSRLSSRLTGSNLLFINTYNVIELVCLFLVIKLNSPYLKKFYNYLFVFFLCYNIYEFIVIDFKDFEQYQSYSKSINSIFLLIISLVHIIKDLKADKDFHLSKLFIFMIIYLTFNAFINLPINYLVNYDNMVIFVIWFLNMLNINTFYTFIVYHLWKNGKTHK